MSDEAAVTRDSLRRGAVVFFQPRHGYRTSLDPVLLAGFVTPPIGRFVEIGAGCGLLSFLLLRGDPAASGVAIELQPRLHALAERGLAENQLAARLALRLGDARALEPPLPARAFDLVVTNPPFRPVGSGTLPEDAERRLSNFEVALRLADWVALARDWLAPGGRLCAVLPAMRRAALDRALAAHGLVRARSRGVRPFPGARPSRLLFEARRLDEPLAGRPREEPALVVHARSGGFTEEVRALLGD